MNERYDPPAEFLAACDAAGIELTPEEVDRLARYLWLLLDANTRFNLTAIREPDEAWMRHVFDSLTLLPHLLGGEVGSVIDVGAGGGLPGIPLAICLPEVKVTLLEATGKKARFLEQVASDLALDHVSVVNDRAETAGQSKQHRERYDVAVARAVGPMRVMLELTMPLVRVDGRVLAMKGRQAEPELDEAGDALMILGDGEIEVYDAVGEESADAVIVAVTKQAATPKAYPRRPGEPKLNPL